MIKDLLLVGLGGGIGSALRWLISLLIINRFTVFPWPTFAVNVLGSVLIGLFYGYLLKNGMSDTLKLFFITGFCGGFTTFSAFSYENIFLIQSGMWQTAALYIVLSLLLCFASTFIALYITIQ